MKGLKKILSCAVATGVALMSAIPLTGCSGKNDANTFTIWLSPSSALYEEYKDLTLNPVMQYVCNKFDIKLEFQIPNSGSEAEQFNVLTASGDFPDIMDLSYYTGAVVDLVTDGVALDMTKYIYPSSGDSLLPNYAGFLNGDPELKNSISTLDNKFYTLYTIDDEYRAPWGGYMYRKDLVYKYAKAEDAEGEAKPAEWTDKEDIVFPSGTAAPDLLSDYDWMFKVLKRAVSAGELDYVTQLYYPGYLETGDLVSAWGINAHWYKEVVDGKTTVKFGGNTDEFKSYIKHMKSWWDAGYIDRDFSSRATDQFFLIDGPAVTAGRVGCFYGDSSVIGDTLKHYEGVDQNIDYRAGYMPRLTKDSEPIMYYSDTRTNRNLMITTKVLDKNYEKLFAALDYLYGEEGSIMTRLGLNKAQYQELKDEGLKFWDNTLNLTEEEQAIAGVTGAKHKLSEIGMYYKKDDINKYVYWDEMETDYVKGGYEMCGSGMNFWGLSAVSKMQYIRIAPEKEEAQYHIWNVYSNKGNIERNMINKLSSKDNADYNINYKAIKDYMDQEVPKFIKGLSNIDTGWKTFCNQLAVKGCNKNTKYLQSIYDSLEG